jgi:D-alanyl-D-alanine endopeptidase (penicillin-binding protein 7)
MTVMVVLDQNQPLDEIIKRKFFGTNLTRRQLIELAIVKSDNNAAKTLCDYYPNGYNACIEAMNNKARELHMYHTHFTDPTGLYKENVSTASDLVKLLDAASKYPPITEDSNKYMVTYSVGKKKTISFRNTNPLVKDLPFEVSKTGFIRNAGGCVAMIVRTTNGIRTVIILGSKTIRTRIPEAGKIISLL